MAARTPDHYAVLGVKRDASAEEIDRAYRKLARENHPDTLASNKTLTDEQRLAAKQLMQQANVARGVLKDPQARAAYDRSLRFSGGTVSTPAPVGMRRWTAEQSDAVATKLVAGRSVGETATVGGNLYSIELVTFGDGAGAVEKPALCLNGAVLQKDAAAPTSHPAASIELHQMYGSTHTQLAADFDAARKSRTEFAALITDFRQRLVGADTAVAEGNRVDLPTATYEIRVVEYGHGKKGRLLLFRDGRCLERLPADGEPTLMASNTDYDRFLGERGDLALGIAEFMTLRTKAWGLAPKIRYDLNAGDTVTVNDTDYTFDGVEWQRKGEDFTGFLLCADSKPLERPSGRAVYPEQRGTSLTTLRKFNADANVVAAAFDDLRTLRRQLRQALMAFMNDTQAGDPPVVFKGKLLRIEQIEWNDGTNEGISPALCLGNAVLSFAPGVILNQNFRLPSLEECRLVLSSLGELSQALEPNRQLHDARRQLCNVINSRLMPDLRVGDAVQFGKDELHVQNLEWSVAGRTHTSPVLCYGAVALNHTNGTLTAEGYELPTLEQAKGFLRVIPDIEAALQPTTLKRKQEREQREFLQREAERRAENERRKQEAERKKDGRRRRVFDAAQSISRGLGIADLPQTVDEFKESISGPQIPGGVAMPPVRQAKPQIPDVAPRPGAKKAPPARSDDVSL